MVYNSHEKLIRDGIPALAAAEGRELLIRHADPSEMVRLLGLKLIEETHEVLEAVRLRHPQQVLDELADLQTVMDEIAVRHGLSRSDIEQRAREKHAERGGFQNGLVLQNAPASPQSPGRRLHVGGSSTLLDALKHEFEICSVARLAVAFVMRSGLELIEAPVLAALLRGAELRFLTTDYLGVTEPEALERLCGWYGNVNARVFSQTQRSFHPKAYLFERKDGSGRAFIGSANLSRMGLVEGVEWTWSVLDIDAGQPMRELTTRFEELFASNSSKPLTRDWIRDYSYRRVVQTAAGVAEPPAEFPDAQTGPQPREVQKLALVELERLRHDGESRALVVAATGLGKTFLAAFDARNANRVLFIAHREELLRQAEDAFAKVYPFRSRGWLADGRSELDREIVFASIQTLSRPEHLARPELSEFDYVIIDEFHHAAAESYQRVLDVLAPKFLLGLTATPFRSDQRDLLALCDHNLAYQVGLLEAITFGWLVPFNYHGIADVVNYSDDLLTTRKTYDSARLTLRVNTVDRAELVAKHYRLHAGQAALGFCVSIEHAEFMAQQFNRRGIPSAAVHSGPASHDRVDAVDQLKRGDLKVLFTVDLFNEGVDIPSVDLVMFLRPTESMTIYLQQLGRGLRLHANKARLTVLDFIGNYRQAHIKLPLLAGQDLSQDQDPRRALKALNSWIVDGERPDGIPPGVEITLEPVALSALRESLQRANSQKRQVLDDLEEIAARLSRTPTLSEWQRQSRYSLRTARSALGVDRWNGVLKAAGRLDDTAARLETSTGEFLRELEVTPMTKSFKMVVLRAMTDGSRFRRSVTGDELIAEFKRYFSEERHRDDVIGSEVEAVATTDDATWFKYLRRNPIAAWTVSNSEKSKLFFSWEASNSVFRYIGPEPAEADDSLFTAAIADRVTARLESYHQRPTPGRMVFSVIPTGADKLCVMFGNNAEGRPMGWHLVSINGKSFYGKFVKVALNVLKETPSESESVPNVLTTELRKLLGDPLPPRARVRLTRQTGVGLWILEKA